MWIDGKDPNKVGQYHEYITRILDKLYLDTWVSLVVESTFLNTNIVYSSAKNI